MLEVLDQIPWDKLRIGTGASAERIPDLIRQMFDLATRDNASEALTNRVYHQGTLYSASAYVIPFIFELLSLEETPRKDELLYLLNGLSPASADYWDVIDYSQWQGWQQESRLAFVAGFPIILSLVDHPDPKVRIEAIGHFDPPKFYSDFQTMLIVNKLQALIVSELNLDVKMKGVEVLGSVFWGNKAFLNRVTDHCVNLLSLVWRNRERRDLTITAAVSIAKILEEQTPSHIVQFLAENARAVQWDVIDDLWHLENNRYIPILSEAIENAPDPEAARRLADRLLSWVLNRDCLAHTFIEPRMQPDGIVYYPPSRQTVSAADFSQDQKQALQAVLNADKVWEESHNLLEAFGLPANRDKARAFLNQV